MRLVAAIFDGFKSLFQSELPLGGLTVVFGANGSGKSNALEGVRVVLEQIRGDTKHALAHQRVDPGADYKDHVVAGGVIVELPNCDIEGHLDEEILQAILLGGAQEPREGPMPERETSMAGLPPFLLPLFVPVPLVWAPPAFADVPGFREFWDSVRQGLVPSVPQARDFWANTFAHSASAVSFAERLQLCHEICRSRTFLIHPEQGIRIVVPHGQLSADTLATAARVADTSERNSDPIAECCARLVSPMNDHWSRWVETPVISPMSWSLRRILSRALPEVIVLDPSPFGLEEFVRQQIAANSLDSSDREIIANPPNVISPDQWNFTVATKTVFGMDPEQELRSRISRVPDNWFKAPESGDLGVSNFVKRSARAIAELANRHAPSFVQEAGRIGIELVSPALYDSYPARLRVVMRESNGRQHDIASLGSGIARGIAGSIREACRLLTEADAWLEGEQWPAPGSRYPGSDYPIGHALGALESTHPTLFIVDEPEAHLHPRAVASFRIWLAELTRRNADVLVATHSTELLDTPDAIAHLIRAHRDDGVCRLSAMDNDLLGTLSHFAETIGLTPGHLIQLVRGILIVEGPFDVQVINRFFRIPLAKARLVLVPLHGSTEAQSLAESQFLRQIGKEIVLLFDNVTRAHIEAIKNREPGVVLSPEARQMEKLVRVLPEARLLAYDEPDIVCALPEDVTAEVLRDEYNIRFPGWASVIAAYNARGSGAFKTCLLQSLNFPLKNQPAWKVADKLANQVLAACTMGSRPSPALCRAIEEALALLDPTESPNAT